MSPELTTVLNDARESLQRHQNHLMPGYRHAIYAAFGPEFKVGIFPPPYPDSAGFRELVRTDQLPKTTNQSGLRRRLFISIITARKVLFWCGKIDENNIMSQSLIDMAEKSLNGKADRQEAGALFESCSLKIDELCEKPEARSTDYRRATYAVLSAQSALMIAFRDIEFNPAFINLEMQESELDPWSADVAYWAVVAYTGSVRGLDFDPDRSLEFWQWWLNDAVPAAYNSV